MAKVVELMKHLKDNKPPAIKKPLDTNIMTDIVDKYYVDFISIDDKAELFSLTKLAQKIEFSPLLKLTTCKIACLISEMTIEEQREYFEITNDQSEGVLGKIKEDNKAAKELII
jgi:hypothetical protein